MKNYFIISKWWRYMWVWPNPGTMKENIDKFSHLEIKTCVKKCKKPDRKSKDWRQSGKNKNSTTKDYFPLYVKSFLEWEKLNLEGKWAEDPSTQFMGKEVQVTLKFPELSSLTSDRRAETKPHHIVPPLSPVSHLPVGRSEALDDWWVKWRNWGPA